MERNDPAAQQHSAGSTAAAVTLQQRRKLLMRVSRQFPSAAVILVAAVTVFLSSCSTSIPIPKRNTTAVKKNPVSSAAPVRQLIPDGWADITSRSKQPQIRQWLVNRDYSATMVLRELMTDSATYSDLLKEEMNVVAEISLRGKVPQTDTDFRVTRVPTQIDEKRKLSSYAYSEKGMLRRVVVFRKQSRFLELELMQEQSGAQFDTLTDDLVEFASMLYDR